MSNTQGFAVAAHRKLVITRNLPESPGNSLFGDRTKLPDEVTRSPRFCDPSCLYTLGSSIRSEPPKLLREPEESGNWLEGTTTELSHRMRWWAFYHVPIGKWNLTRCLVREVTPNLWGDSPACGSSRYEDGAVVLACDSPINGGLKCAIEDNKPTRVKLRSNLRTKAPLTLTLFSTCSSNGNTEFSVTRANLLENTHYQTIGNVAARHWIYMEF
ncbi:hypothetical protein FIBSPDRAFT_903508 [Athelia psychrophila]|uniref:Uncharacterized protein n=1 Tax=Athelia psychrophila TaxID=1759441 RepID=A0A167VVY9_9AGAM|nr:hypothetical protein FIBSPDRAFT_903508 [Fibularhizoctonia sp. CBS 109695]